MSFRHFRKDKPNLAGLNSSFPKFYHSLVEKTDFHEFHSINGIEPVLCS